MRTWRDPWERASLDMKVRPDKPKRNVSRSDLLIPRGHGVPKMLALTFVGGVGMAVLYVLAPLMAILIATSAHVPALWLWIGIGGVAITLWLTLLLLAVRESGADRRYAARL